MNFLAHMYLSCAEQELICGNFLGDFIKNRELNQIPADWLPGVRLHRDIDTFTDGHLIVKNCTKLIHSTQGKYAPVVMDVFFDYVLYKNWKKYSGITFDDFEEQIYSSLSEALPLMPPRLKFITEDMVTHHWLRSYTTVDGLEFTFKKLKERMRFPSNVDYAIEDLEKHWDYFNDSFNEFFPEIIKMAHDYCHC